MQLCNYVCKSTNFIFSYCQIVDESDGHTNVFPIPADVRALNSNLTQNPGY